MVEDEEKLQLRADVERFRRMIRQKDEMIEEMEHELSRPKTPGDKLRLEARERDLASKIRDLELEIDAKNVTIHKKEGQIEELRDEVDKLEKSNRDLAYRPESPQQDTSSSFMENELARLSEELDKCRETNSALMQQNLELEKENIQLKSDHESAMEHVKSLEVHLKTREEELGRLESENFQMKAAGHGSHASAGNSIFAEAMEAERKLEEDLKSLFAQNQCLIKKVRRLQIDKDDAEQRVQSAMQRKYVVSSAINTQGYEEMVRLRQKVRELEVERTRLWEKLFVKLRRVNRKELGPLVLGYHESFKLSIASVTGNQENVLKENEELATKIQGLEKMNAEKEEKIEQLKYELATAQREKKVAAALESATEDFASEKDQNIPLKQSVLLNYSRKPKQPEIPENPDEEQFTSGRDHPLLNAPLKPMNSGVRPSFFVKPKKEPVERTMMNMSIDPQSSFQTIPQTPTSGNDRENISDFTFRYQKAKAERKAAATPAKLSFNYVQLIQPTTTSTSKFKPATLQMPKIDD